MRADQAAFIVHEREIGARGPGSRSARQSELQIKKVLGKCHSESPYA